MDKKQMLDLCKTERLHICVKLDISNFVTRIWVKLVYI